ncbi:class I SAM-dependent methyltransferase [Streptomyces fildesensis]|uniref:Class I SAM-dependent methyltransferase n=1 Tax=Streptomyces fildesensis TaxID=375757 RepID=A0ABW8CI60_9ACTN
MTDRPGLPEDLDRPERMWERGAVLALMDAVSTLGAEYFLSDDGLTCHHSNGSWTLNLLPDGGRAFFHGQDVDCSDTTYAGDEPVDVLVGAPDWLPKDMLRELVDGYELGYLYWWEDGKWARAAYPDFVEDDGLIASCDRGVLDSAALLENFDTSDGERAEFAERFIARVAERSVDTALLRELMRPHRYPSDKERESLLAAAEALALRLGVAAPADSSGTRVQEVAARYDELAEGYDRTGPPFYALAGQILVDAMELTPGGHVLDAGCGRGACLFPAAAAVGTDGRAVGVDISPGMVRATAAEAAARGLSQVEVLVGDAAAPEFAAGTFSAVTSGFVLRQLTDVAAVLRSYGRLLRPAGTVGICDFVPGFPSEWAEVERVLAPAAPVEESLAGHLTAAGFTGVREEDRTVELTFAGPAQWWDYLPWSVHRARVMDLSPEQREHARAAACAAARRLCAPDGSLVMPVRIRCTIATRAQELPTPATDAA